MSYIYADKIGAGPEHPAKQWGLFTRELTPDQAAELYALNAAQRNDWFGVVRLEDGQQRPTAYLKVCPQGNGIELHRLSGYGSITAAYAWGAYYEPRNDAPFEGTADRPQRS
ncbi:hypothetical protein G7085_11085 [Tessaracoccus sp. HDW20]|uniref:hypothetical protein n=1 Tax=Tessaracoccus coleopterorum TaxID=2714950 RepID=UPI0018D2DD0C|nr:hypothetical protein [Tessaracoccus coleopterorum]NHB84972.1 hypothetical protein [Tessaracoccus coleopterorum]